jgi:hypothetical protein
MREIRSSGSVRGGAGNIPAYSARDLDQRRGTARIGFIEAVEAGIAVGVQEAATAGEQGSRMLALAVGRVQIADRRRRRSAPRTFVANQRP